MLKYIDCPCPGIVTPITKIAKRGGKMKRRIFILTAALILIFVLLAPLFSTAEIISGKPGNQVAKITAGKVEIKDKKLQVAGMNVHLKDPKKHHSIDAYLEIPFTHKGYHDCKVHLDKSRKKVIAAFIRKPFIIEDHNGFKYTIKNAVFDKKTNCFVGHGTIEGTYLPGKLYASHIKFNKKGIINVDHLRKKGDCGGCRITNFPYTAHKIKWTNKGIKSSGMLNLGKFHADVAFLVTSKGIKSLRLLEPAHCLIESRPATITKLTLKGNQIYVDGKSVIYTGKVLPNAKRPKPFSHHKTKKGHTGILPIDISLPPMEIVGNMGVLPGTRIVQIADSNMKMTVTSADIRSGIEILSGFISLPKPITRVNVFEAKSFGKEAELDNAKMYWQKKQVRIPITNDKLTLKHPIKFEEDEETHKKKLVADIDGIIHVMEIFAPGSKILVDNYTIDYRVDATSIKGRSLNAVGKYTSAFLNVDEKIQFDVLQGRSWIGFKCDVNLGKMSFSPGNVSWFKAPVMNKPSLFFEIHTDGYVKIRITTGSGCKIPIIPELLTLEDPGFFFLRQPGLVTEFQVTGTFLPPPDEGNVLRIDADFYVDMAGMYLGGGSGLKVWLFDMDIGDIETAFSSANMSFTIQGDFKIFGYKLLTANCRIILNPENKRGGSTFFKGSTGIRIPYPCHCHWNWIPPFVHCKWCHKTVGFKIEIDWNASVHLHLGTYHFKMPHGTKQAEYDGPFKADGITYDGTLIIDQKTGIKADGKTKDITSRSGNDTADTTLSLSGSWLSDEMMTGTITGKVSLDLKPHLPGTDGVNLSFSGLKPKFVKDPSTNLWRQVNQKSVEVKFNYKENGNYQQFDQSCPLRMNMDDSALHIDLDLPAKFGGTYVQSFILKSK